MTPEEFKKALLKQDKRATEILSKDERGDVRPPKEINEESFSTVPAELPSDDFFAVEEGRKKWVARELRRNAIDIAIACLSSTRHYTLNDGFAKQCVEFAKSLAKESGVPYEDKP